MKRWAIVLVGLASACGRSAADHEELGDRAYAAGAYRDALAEYQLGVKAGASPDLHAKSAAAALHTQDYAFAAAEYRELADRDRSRVGEAAEGLERIVRAAVAANDRSGLATALAALQAVAPSRPLGRYARLVALDAAARAIPRPRWRCCPWRWLQLPTDAAPIRCSLCTVAAARPRIARRPSRRWKA